LLVADPQLIGENDEPFYYSALARWDSDRYLRSNYILANSYVKPDATLYLGDLFDEGLKSSDEQIARYFERFQAIFECERMQKQKKIKQYFISGDNDIGGEYYGDRNDYLAERFERYFGEIIQVLELNSFVNLVKLDIDYTVSFYNQLKRNYVRKLVSATKSKQQDTATERFTLILNHMTLLNKRDTELNDIIEDTNAGLIIKGDSHEFYIAKYNIKANRVKEFITKKNNPTNLFTFHLQSDKSEVENLYELSVPTCSYRMGVPNMGYGMLTISPKGIAHVSILWLPSRFTSIKFYLAYLTCVFVFMVVSLARVLILKHLEFAYRNFQYKFNLMIRSKKQSIL